MIKDISQIKLARTEYLNDLLARQQMESADLINDPTTLTIRCLHQSGDDGRHEARGHFL
jgi:hypothetical protein